MQCPTPLILKNKTKGKRDTHFKIIYFCLLEDLLAIGKEQLINLLSTELAAVSKTLQEQLQFSYF